MDSTGTGRECVVATRRLDTTNFSPHRIPYEPSVNTRVDNTSSLYHPSTINFEPLKSEQARLNTFYTADCPWPISFVSPADCAKSGFFFLKDGDKVQCAFCRGVAGEWDEGDIPSVEHKKHFPRCPFICNLPVGNIPIPRDGEEDAAAPLHIGEPPHVNESYGYDVCGPFEDSMIASEEAYRTRHQVHVRGALPLAGEKEDVTSLAIRTGRGPLRKNLVTVDARLKTFAEWPQSTGQSPDKMADAGFYYIGCEDHVKCFYCDGGLRNWEQCDDPWHEHARWFGNCPYVLLSKGRHYVEKAISSKPEKPKTSVSSQSSEDDEVSSTTSSVASGSADVPNPDSESPSSSTSGVGSGSDSDEDITVTKPVKESTKPLECQVAQPMDESKCVKTEGHDMAEELRQLKEARQCKICMDDEVGVVFLPCGHLVSCVRCATALSSCALCRQPIKAVVRTYLS